MQQYLARYSDIVSMVGEIVNLRIADGDKLRQQLRNCSRLIRLALRCLSILQRLFSGPALERAAKVGGIVKSQHVGDAA